MCMALERAEDRANVEYIFAVNDDDDCSATLAVKVASLLGESKCIRGPFKGSAEAWDAAAKVSTGEILVQMQDDLELPQDWDTSLWSAIENNYGIAMVAFASGQRKAYSMKPCIVAVSDGYRKDALLCTAIMNRARYEQQGEFLHAGYQSVFSDDEHTIRAIADDADGKCTLIQTDLVFLHRHHYHDKSVPFDATYERENNIHAYAHGERVFLQRNAELLARGLRTWK